MTTPAGYNDAYELLTRMLNDWGIDDLNDTVKEILTQGYTPDVAELRLRDTPQYKQRFVANDKRIKQGLPALSPAEYIATERAYVSTAREFGLPEGFYDQPTDLQKWLETDVSPQEFRERAQAASQTYIQAPDDVKEQWSSLYGLTPGDAVASFLDPNRAMAVLQKRAQATSIAAEAQRAFDNKYQINATRAEQLADAGVSQGQAQKGYREVASRLGRDQFLGRLSGQDFTQTEAENELLLDDAKAATERAKIYDEEKGRFQQNYLPTTSAGLARQQGNY